MAFAVSEIDLHGSASLPLPGFGGSVFYLPLVVDLGFLHPSPGLCRSEESSSSPFFSGEEASHVEMMVTNRGGCFKVSAATFLLPPSCSNGRCKWWSHAPLVRGGPWNTTSIDLTSSSPPLCGNWWSRVPC